MKPGLKFLWILIPLVPLFWLAWPSRDNPKQETETLGGVSSGNQAPGGRSRITGASEAASSAAARRMEGRGEPADLTGVDRILADDGISHQQAAVQLRHLAMDPANSIEDRLEALQHGLNLHAESFADFAQPKDLPSELASHYLHEMINHNDSPSMQIRCYMALMNHPDAEVAGLATDMLALEVGDEEQQSTREKLLVVGQSMLAKLASEAGK